MSGSDADRERLMVEVAAVLGCDPHTITPDGFTMAAHGHGAVVTCTLTKRISREDATRLLGLLDAADARPSPPPDPLVPK